MISSALNLISALVFLFVVPVVTFYLLVDWDRMLARIDALLPRDHAPVVRKLAAEIDMVLNVGRFKDGEHQVIFRELRDVVGTGISPVELRRCVFSIFGQCLFYRHGYAVIQRLHPKLRYDAKEIAATAQHITEFSLAGLKQIADKPR